MGHVLDDLARHHQVEGAQPLGFQLEEVAPLPAQPLTGGPRAELLVQGPHVVEHDLAPVLVQARGGEAASAGDLQHARGGVLPRLAQGVQEAVATVGPI
jgi:hypothetical protein